MVIGITSEKAAQAHGGDEDVEDLLGGVGARREVVGGEHGQRRRLAEALVLELVAVERLAEELALQPVARRRRAASGWPIRPGSGSVAGGARWCSSRARPGWSSPRSLERGVLVGRSRRTDRVDPRAHAGHRHRPPPPRRAGRTRPSSAGRPSSGRRAAVGRSSADIVFAKPLTILLVVVVALVVHRLADRVINRFERTLAGEHPPARRLKRRLRRTSLGQRLPEGVLATRHLLPSVGGACRHPGRRAPVAGRR